VALHERLFGMRPVGLWPSEGSVSDAMVPLVAQAGFRWMATDEDILARTLGQPFTRNADGHLDQPVGLYQPYALGRDAETVACAFRDHALSDLIGFRYGSWSAEGAADDFVGRLVEGGRRYAAQGGRGEPTVFVILDGENAWEYYDGQGRPFLRALYGALGAHPELRTVTMAEACAQPQEALPSVFPGSWINADFYIWIGHADDHRAWEQLVAARRALETPLPGLSAESLARAREEMLIAEGSDWFWWYGDDHSSDHDLDFDELFRRHVRNVYRALELPIPEELFVSNITTQPPAADIDAPTGFIQPAIDGEVTSYFEWVGAGCVEAEGGAGAMHQVSGQTAAVSVVEFGFDLESLFVRLDGSRPMRELLAPGVEAHVAFLKPAGLQVVLRRQVDGVAAGIQERVPGGQSIVRTCHGLVAAVGRIAELRLPFECLGVAVGAPVAFQVVLTRDGVEVERYPRHRAIEIEVPTPRFVARNWTA
jgi:alpha-amylase/alpha-mannosidase (GH57 family)